MVGSHIIPGAEIAETFDTHGGPGGQHANRTRSAVRLRFDISRSSLPDQVKAQLEERLGPTVEATASDSRSQFRNRALARKRLATKLEEALAEKAPRRPTSPGRASRQKRLAAKRARGDLKRQRRRPDVDD